MNLSELTFAKKYTAPFLTSKNSNSIINIGNITFFQVAMMHSYQMGYIKCYQDINDRYKESLSSTTQQGGYVMDENRIYNQLDKLTDKIDNIDKKLDEKFDKINQSFSELNREVGELKTKIDNIKEKNYFWKSYIIAPIVTAIITALLMKFVIK